MKSNDKTADQITTEILEKAPLLIKEFLNKECNKTIEEIEKEIVDNREKRERQKGMTILEKLLDEYNNN